MNLDTGQPSDERIDLRLRGPADLVTAVPYLLGFHPRDSLVLVGTRAAGGAQVEVTLRVDLPPPRLVGMLAGQLAGGLAARGCDGALVAVVGAVAPPPADDPPHRELVEALTAACARDGVAVRGAAWAAEIVAGAPWRCYDRCRCGGSLPDPSCSSLAAAMVTAGRVTYGDRSELERLVAPADESVLQRRSDLLDRRVDEASRAGRPAEPGGLGALELLARWVEDVGAGPVEMGDDDVVEVCLALSDPLVRDAAFGLAIGSEAAAAERLWSLLVVESPDPEAAEPAVLLAYSALLRGDGALAGVALERAQLSWPGHRLSTMFLAALDAGHGPDELRAWLSDGSRRALTLLARRADPR